MQFSNSFFLTLAILIVPLAWLYFRRIKRKENITVYSDTSLIKKVVQRRWDWRRHIRVLLPVFKVISFSLIVIAMARPQSISQEQEVSTEGIDIVIVVDVSGSMMAMDFTPNRMEAAKRVASDFIKARSNDRIGLTLFAKYAFTQCPLTIDHSVLLQLVQDVEIGITDADHTAIGSAIVNALNRLKDSDSKSKVIILLTDGENNFGIPPLTAAEAAVALGVKIYTIGVGTRGQAPFPARDMFGRTTTQMVNVTMDEEMMTQIAGMTGGRYYRATDDRKLESIFNEIDRMERTKIEVRAFRRYKELFTPYVGIAALLLFVGLLVSSVISRELL